MKNTGSIDEMRAGERKKRDPWTCNNGRDPKTDNKKDPWDTWTGRR
jgi:hypothetical protein